MRFAVVGALASLASASASLSACGSSDLQPIQKPDSIGVDAALTSAEGGGRGDAPAPALDASAGGGGLCKRGMASHAPPSAAFAPSASSPGISWWYNYAVQSAGGVAGIEFVPMLWGSGSLGMPIPSGSKYLLGFNEPNFTSEARLTAQQAASDWPQVEAEAAGIPIVSPGVNYCPGASDGGASGCTEPTVTDPYTYLKEFFAACRDCKVDYIAVHWYNCDVPSLRAYLEGNGDGGLEGFVQFGKPIWLTEFACGSGYTVEQQKAYMPAAVEYLESNPRVARYAWFSASPIPNAELANSDGTLTDLGTIYVGLPENCP